jgi:hypothetical protein
MMYALPAADPLGLRTFWGLHSRVVYAVLTRWDAFDSARHESDTVEADIQRQGFDHPGFQQAVNVTTRIMAMVRRRVASVPIVAFSCDVGSPYTEAFDRVSAANQVEFLPEVAAAVSAAEARGESVRAADFHWNARGHAVIAAALEPYARSVQARAGAPWPG